MTDSLALPLNVCDLNRLSLQALAALPEGHARGEESSDEKIYRLLELCKALLAVWFNLLESSGYFMCRVTHGNLTSFEWVVQ